MLQAVGQAGIIWQFRHVAPVMVNGIGRKRNKTSRKIGRPTLRSGGAFWVSYSNVPCALIRARENVIRLQASSRRLTPRSGGAFWVSYSNVPRELVRARENCKQDWAAHFEDRWGILSIILKCTLCTGTSKKKPNKTASKLQASHSKVRWSIWSFILQSTLGTGRSNRENVARLQASSRRLTPRSGGAVWALVRAREKWIVLRMFYNKHKYSLLYQLPFRIIVVP